MKAVSTVRGALAAAMMGVLSSCVLPPKTAPQRQPVAEASLGLTGSAVSAAPAAWWESFGDPQLNALVAAALRDNPALAQAQSRVQVAQSQATVARSGERPDLNLSAGESRIKFPDGFPQAIGGGTSDWVGDLGIQLGWDLDLWGEHQQLARAASDLASAADLDVDNARLLLAGAVAQAYVDLYRNYALADIAERAEAQRNNILQIARQRVTAGLDTRVEVREAEGALPQAHLTLLQAQSAQALAKHHLAALTGRGADLSASIQRPQLNLQAAVAVPSELPINLLQRRPDVIAARIRVQAADHQQLAAKAAFYPHISLKALAGFASFKVQDLISAESFGYEAGPALSLPLFDAGRLRAQYQGSHAQLDQAVASYDETVLRAVRQSADQLTLIDSLTGELQQQQRWSDAAEEAYKLDQERYQAGLASYLSVLNAETEVLNARRQGVELVTALATARINLLLAVGGDFQAPTANVALASR